MSASIPTATAADPETKEMPAQDAGVEEGADTDQFPRAFGNYVLLHRLARGGMGNVFLAKTGTMGIEKHCVVKTLRARFTGDAEYVERFMAEARVVVQLSHRNICPVFDVGRVGHSYYLAMELVVGRDVRSIQLALQDRGRTLPMSCALHICAEMLDALDYAHRHQDPVSGEPLHLVHRDVSPQNVMINAEGEVKLIDFGLAESTGVVNTSEPVNTGTTTVMGKIAYMAPEHARGDAVDARADQFSAGIVAYELLSSQRYYAGMGTQQVWAKAGLGTYRPKELTSLDPPLAAILSRALAANREDRYLTCGDFKDALQAYARSRGLHDGGREMRAIAQEIYVDDVREMRELLQRFAHVARHKIPGFVAAEETTQDGGNLFMSIASSRHVDTMVEPTELLTRSGFFPAPPPRKRWPLALAAVAVAVCAATVGAVVAVQARTPEVVMVAPAPVEPPQPPQILVVEKPVEKIVEKIVEKPSDPVQVEEPPPSTKPTKRRPRPQPTAEARPKQKRFEEMLPDEKINALYACREKVPCARRLAAEGGQLKVMTATEVNRWLTESKTCWVKCNFSQ